MIKAVILDADGVVIYPWRFAQYREREHGITREMTQDFFHGVFNDCLVGKADLKEELVPFLPKWKWHGSVDEFVDTWLEVENAIDERVVNVVYTLRKAGLICCLATNQEKNRASYMTNQMGLSDIFDALFFSCFIEHKKPDRLFYKHIEKALQLEGSDILFWDDSPSCVEGALACGWNAKVYVDFENFKTELASYLDRGHLLLTEE